MLSRRRVQELIDSSAVVNYLSHSEAGASSRLGVASALVHRFQAGVTQRFNSRFKLSMEESLP
jgi:hypothetical protein